MGASDDPDGAAPEGTALADGFRNPIDALIVNSVQRLMNDVAVTLDDDFFEIGGNSILAVRVGQIIREEFGVRRGARMILEHPVLRDFSDTLNDLLKDARHG